MHRFPLTVERDAVVRRRMAARIADRSEANYQSYRMLPGLRDLSGRERLAFYEAQPETYWAELFATNPAEAHVTFMDFAELVRLYR